MTRHVEYATKDLRTEGLKDLPSEGDTRGCHYRDDSRFVVLIFMHLAELQLQLQARVTVKNKEREGVGAAPSLIG